MHSITITTKSGTSGHEMAARITKALRFVTFIDATMLADSIDPHEHAEQVRASLEQQPETDWARWGVLLGSRPPSEETRALVLCIYAARAEARRLAPQVKSLL